MARREAQIITCDRCDLEVELDITAYDIPDRWLSINDFGILCPKCARRFREITTAFFGNGVPKEWDIENHAL